MLSSLKESIRQKQNEGLFPVLAELKVRSPKEGDLLRGRDPVALVQCMCSCAIAGLSVVTESRTFGGHLDLVAQVRPHVTVPIVRKDYHRRVDDLRDTVNVGANAVVLNASLLDDNLLLELNGAASDLGIESVVTVHSTGELARVTRLNLKPDIIGINNRDIRVRETDDGDVSVTEQVAAHVPAGTLALSESSIRGAQDVRRARDAGADAVLVGTSILVRADTVKAIEELIAVGWTAS